MKNQPTDSEIKSLLHVKRNLLEGVGMNLVRVLPIAVVGGFVIKTIIAFFLKEPFSTSFAFYLFSFVFLMSLLGVASLAMLRAKCAKKDDGYEGGFTPALALSGKILSSNILAPGEYVAQHKAIIKDSAVCFLVPSVILAIAFALHVPVVVSLIVLGSAVGLWSAQLNTIQANAYEEVETLTRG